MCRCRPACQSPVDPDDESAAEPDDVDARSSDRAGWSNPSWRETGQAYINLAMLTFSPSLWFDSSGGTQLTGSAQYRLIPLPSCISASLHQLPRRPPSKLTLSRTAFPPDLIQLTRP